MEGAEDGAARIAECERRESIGGADARFADDRVEWDQFAGGDAGAFGGNYLRSAGAPVCERDIRAVSSSSGNGEGFHGEGRQCDRICGCSKRAYRDSCAATGGSGFGSWRKCAARQRPPGECAFGAHNDTTAGAEFQRRHVARRRRIRRKRVGRGIERRSAIGASGGSIASFRRG